MIVKFMMLPEVDEFRVEKTGSAPKRRMYWSGDIRIVSNGQPIVQPISSGGERLYANEMHEWVQNEIAKELREEFPIFSFIKVTIKTSNEPKHD